jgi:SnoaL-like domain
MPRMTRNKKAHSTSYKISHKVVHRLPNMSHTHPQILTSLTEREAITDALYRAIIGFDSNNVSIFNSAFIGEDIVFDFNGTAINGLDTVRKQFLDLVGPMDTTHMLSNIRVDVKEGASTASLNAYALAQHCPPGRGNEPNGPKFLAASEYFIDVVKDKSDGTWKIEKWVMKIIWSQGDASVMQRPG